MINLIKEHGRTLEYSNAGNATIPGGTMLKVGSIIGIAARDIDPGDIQILVIEGVFRLPKLTNVAMAQGAAVFVDHVSGLLTTAASTAGANNDPATLHVRAGIAYNAATATAPEVEVKINFGA
jgi:predicted RecA/RadA family phage recombinase